MIVPVRCFSCGNAVGDYYEEFKKRVSEGESAEKVLDDLGLTRYCCRKTLLTSSDLVDEVMKYKV